MSSLIREEECQKKNRRKNQECRNSSEDQKNTDDVDYQLLIIGAGPHALSLLTKLIEPSKDYLEENPSNKNLFKISSNTGRIGAKYKLLPDHIFTQKDGTIRSKWAKSSREKKDHERFLKSVCIIDRNEKWLAQWKHQFHVLEIPNLRSALGAHCDPVDPQSMRIFIEQNGDRDSAVVNLELDRSMAYHGPYEVPKTSIYNSFADSIVQRYHLENTITPGEVDNVELVCCGKGSENEISNLGETSSTVVGPVDANHYFNVSFVDATGAQRKVTARNVVFATGPLNVPVFPEFYSDLDEDEKNNIPEGKLYHSCNIMWAHERTSKCINEFENLLIIGGGLTAGHLATRAIRACKSSDATRKHVTLCSRAPLQSRQFDLDLPWMGRERTSRLASFWAISDYEKRLEHLLNAKNGGSMTPEVLLELEKGKNTGCFTCLEDTDIEYAYFDDESQQWEVQFENIDGPKFFDVIWCATGTKIDMSTGVFRGLHKYMKIVCNRLPRLTNELRIREDVNAFIMGEHAGLTLGPGSVNLMGARAGAARVAAAIKM